MNDLSSLDVSNNKALKTLNCQYNQLKSLDVSGCPHLADSDDYYFNCKNNPDLRCIQISPTQYTKNADSWQKDATQSFNVNCGKGSILGNSLKEQANSTKYEGTLGKNRITLELNLSSDFSLYMYNKYRTPILLKKQNSEKYLEFIEQFPQNGGNAYKNGGRLQLFFKGENKEQIQGKYTSPEGTKTYSVDLRVVKQPVTDLYKYFSEEEIRKNMANVVKFFTKKYPYFSDLLKEEGFRVSPEELEKKWGKATKKKIENINREVGDEIYKVKMSEMVFPEFEINSEYCGKECGWAISHLKTETRGFGFGGVYVGVPECNKEYLLKTFKRYKPEEKEYEGEKTLYIDFHKEFYRQLLIKLDNNGLVKSVSYNAQTYVD